MKAVVAAALVVLSPPPPVCLPRAQILLAAGSEYNAARGAGRSGHAASLQKIIDRAGEAATLEEAQLALSQQGYVATPQNMVDRGEAATLEEAQLVLSRKGNAAALQKGHDRACRTTTHFILAPRLVKTEQLPASMKTPYLPWLGPRSAMPGQSAPALARWLPMPSGAAYVSDIV